MSSFLCGWEDCTFTTNSPSTFYTHGKTVHLNNLSAVQRFQCHWGTCKAIRSSKYDLVQHIVVGHYGSEDERIDMGGVSEAKISGPRELELAKEINGLTTENQRLIKEFEILEQKNYGLNMILSLKHKNLELLQDDIEYYKATAKVLEDQHRFTMQIFTTAKIRDLPKKNPHKEEKRDGNGDMRLQSNNEQGQFHEAACSYNENGPFLCEWNECAQLFPNREEFGNHLKRVHYPGVFN